MNRGLIFYLIYGVIVLLLIELVLRLCFPLPEIANFNRINYQILDRRDDKSGYLRNIHMIWKSVLDTNHAFEHHLNRYGYRDSKEWKQKKDPNKKRIFFIGDSFVEGMMSTQEQTIPVGFEKAAGAEAKTLEWFNCGMMGIGLNEYIKFLKDAVPIFHPDEVFMVLYSNDLPFQRAYQPVDRLLPEQYSFWTPRLKLLIEGIKREDPIPFRWMPEKRPFYRPVPDPGNPWTHNENDLKQHVTEKIAAAMKKGDFNYFRTNWILEEEKFLKSDIQVKSKLQFIRDYLSQYGATLRLFYIPSRSQVNSSYYYQFERQACLVNCPDFIDLEQEAYQKHARILQANCSELGIPFKDFTPLIKAKEKAGKHLYWNYDDHMRGRSYLMLGEEIYRFYKQ
jgi:hypothetical protein